MEIGAGLGLGFGGDGAFEPGKKQLVADGEDDSSDEEADDAHSDEAADGAEKDNDNGYGCSSAEKDRLEHIVHETNDQTPDEKDDGLCGAGRSEDVDNGGD